MGTLLKMCEFDLEKSYAFVSDLLQGRDIHTIQRFNSAAMAHKTNRIFSGSHAITSMALFFPVPMQ
jgi:hypothetical protein